MESVKPFHPSTCLCGLCIARQFDGVWRRDRSRIARQIVAASSIEDLCRLPVESRHHLREALNLGFAPGKEREALDKILTADLLTQISATELVVAEYQQGMIIKGGQDFVEKTRSRLDCIAGVATGGRLLRSLATRGLTVTLVPSSRTNDARPDNYRAAVARGKSLKWKDELGKERAIRGNGAGSNTTIRYNPDLSIIGSAEAWQRQPPAIWLAHELIHADDAAYGRMDPELTDGVRNYERQAIGLPPYDRKEFTENRLRAEWSEPQPARPRY
ncbi:MAG TPA: M91 family zinc metallopeptidase [Blastocatellia bacterium]|nr:M91 family zinc metallopeptidase [Blastocatellia bacterium]